jgi:hypothetical protein
VCGQWLSPLTTMGPSVVGLGLLCVQKEKYVNRSMQSVGQVCPAARSPALVMPPTRVRSSGRALPATLLSGQSLTFRAHPSRFFGTERPKAPHVTRKHGTKRHSQTNFSNASHVPSLMPELVVVVEIEI